MRQVLDWLSPRLHLLFLLRYSVFTGLFPWLFLVVALYANPRLLRGLLVLDTPGQLVNVTWLSVLVGTLVMVTMRLVQINAPARFADYAAAGGRPPSPGPWRLRWLLLALIGLPVPVTCVLLTAADPPQRWREWADWTYLPVAVLAAAFAFLGLLLALGILFLFTAAQQLLLSPSVVSQNLLPFESWGPFQALHRHRTRWLYWLGDRLARVAEHFGPGYTQQVTDAKTGQHYLVLAPGHAQAGLWFGGALLGYLLMGWLSLRLGWVFEDRSMFAALFYLLLAVLLVGSLFGGLEFLLDYYRVPVLLSLVAVCVLFSALQHTDHFYELNPGGKALPEKPAVDFQTAIANHSFPAVTPEAGGATRGKRTLVVITAAGGGIQAAAWTTEVLAGLDELYGPEFTRSIGLVSAVSGGSVGTMHFLVNGAWGTAEPLTAAGRDRMRELARRSSLEATGWGVAYPDVVRTFLPFVVPRPLDRGWALEESWRRQIGPPGDARPSDRRLGDLIEPTRAGKMPVVVFNATLAETGERLLISPVAGPASPVHDPNEARDFFTQYHEDKPNPWLSTVVRLSATFPYVSPICRPHREGGAAEPGDYHVADGGYSENEGALTVIQWVHRLLAYYRQHPEVPRPFDRVLVIRIEPFPPEKAPTAETRNGWLYEALGPITTIQNVRVASQAERNSFDLRLFVEESEARSPPANVAERKARDTAQVMAGRSKTEAAKLVRGLAGDPSQTPSPRQQRDLAALTGQGEQFEREAATASQRLVGEAEITWTAFVFPAGKEAAPLSWKLTRSQQDAIGAAWNQVRDGKVPPVENGLNEPPLQTLDRFFRRVGKPGP